MGRKTETGNPIRVPGFFSPAHPARGFSLLELMAVAAIIGVLAAIAIPQYQNYVIRSRVVEGLGLADGARINVWDVLSGGNPQGSPNGYALGYTPPATTANVTSVLIAPATGVITITLAAAAGGGTITVNPYTSPGGAPTALPIGTAPFAPPTEAIQWQCRAAGSALVAPGSAAGTLPGQFAPATCR